MGQSGVPDFGHRSLENVGRGLWNALPDDMYTYHLGNGGGGVGVN